VINSSKRRGGRWPLYLSFVAISAAAAASLFAVQGCKQRVAVSDPKATPEDRRVIGAGVPWRLDPPVDEPLTFNDMEYRRARAWDIVKSMTIEVPIGANGELIPGFAPTGGKPQLPIWQTFYESEEFLEMMSRLYIGFGKDNRKAKARFCPADLEQIFAKHAKRSLRGWTAELLEQRLSQIQSAEQGRVVSGRGVPLFSPGLVRHLLDNYGPILECSRFPRDDFGPTGRLDNHSRCYRDEFPGVHGAEHTAKDEGLEHCTGENGETPRSDPTVAGTAVAIKSTWHAVGTADVAVFDTSAEGMRKLLTGTGEWQPARTVKDGSIPADKVYTIQLKPSERKYQLHGIHFTTKDVRDWMWVSLWWSPEPDEDFGADRPAEFAGTPWANYKMCVTSHFEERDPAPWSHYERSHPSLAAALKVTHEWGAPYTWCSGPYTELGVGNAKTNCIGCHQHAGTPQNTDDIFLDVPTDPANAARRAKFPHNSRSQVRRNFPGEYLWSFSHGPDFFESRIRGKTYEVDLTDR